MKEHEMGVFSAHQMGTCRMSTSPAGGVVDSSGETWECNDLFLMDTSAFPTASGANPMLTVLAISHMLSLRLVERLNNEDEG
jgi:choline dehydrogenase-like flavoprotein